jgi:hypothetical protein
MAARAMTSTTIPAVFIVAAVQESDRVKLLKASIEATVDRGCGLRNYL